MIRPELVARFKPWREVGAAALTGALGLWVFAQGGLFFQPLGGAILAFAVLWGLGASLGFPIGMSAAADDEAHAAARVSVVSTIAYTAFLAGPLGQAAAILRTRSISGLSSPPPTRLVV
mgnify:CR=1 FL=1